MRHSEDEEQYFVGDDINVEEAIKEAQTYANCFAADLSQDDQQEEEEVFVDQGAHTCNLAKSGTM